MSLRTEAALLNFIIEERPYTMEALSNEAFLYAQWLYSKTGVDQFPDAFHMVDGRILFKRIDDRPLDYVFNSKFKINNDIPVFKKDRNVWKHLSDYRRIRNTLVGV